MTLVLCCLYDIALYALACAWIWHGSTTKRTQRICRSQPLRSAIARISRHVASALSRRFEARAIA